jgi:hypothetical protein
LHNRARRNYRAGSHIAARQHNCAVTDPDIMADRHPLGASRSEHGLVVGLAREIRARAIGEVRLARPLHGMVTRIDAGHRGDGAELADARIGDIAAIHDIRIVAERDLEQPGARTDFGIAAQFAIGDSGTRIDQGSFGKRF